jgi:hypothetical protein
MSGFNGMIDWKIGEKPNLGMMYVGFCCLSGIPLICQLHAFRNVLKENFADIDDSQHWLAVIISIYGLYLNDKQLKELEAAKNITAESKMPWWLPIIVPALWPLALADQMNRLNALVEQK